MAKINLNTNFKDLDGKEIENNNIGKTVAQVLSQSTSGNALKFWDWAIKLQAGKELDLDPSDKQTLKEFIENAQNLIILAKAQILALIK